MKMTYNTGFLEIPIDAKLGEIEPIKCPFCGEDYISTIRIGTKKSKDDYSAWSGRGSMDFLEFECECCDVKTPWRLCFGFHKGSTYVYIDTSVEEETKEENLLRQIIIHREKK
jgi:hypothetical protein